MGIAKEDIAVAVRPANDIHQTEDTGRTGAVILRLFAKPAARPHTHDFLDAMRQVEAECYA